MRALVLCLGLLAAGVVVAAPLHLEGEVFARERAAMMPPTIDRLWQLSIARLAPDGAPIAAGEVVVEFDGAEVQKRMLQKSSERAEKQSELDKLLLELADRERAEQVAVAEARAARDKARRKASQPETLLRGVDYRKLVAEREHAERACALAERRQQVAAEARRQERRLLEAELAQLDADLARLREALAALKVTTPRAGIVQHLTDWQGNKFDVGSQVWRGLAVAQVPDPDSLAVQASVPEHLITAVGDAMPVTVVIQSDGSRVPGHVVALGRVVRSKSRLQPVPVRDVEIAFDTIPQGLKPGQSVRVEIER